jgi:RNA recognition motif-containing protein
MNIYVGNLSRQAGESEVRELFSKFGEVKSVKIIKDNESGEPRGFAFVEMPEQNSATQAIRDLESHEFLGRRLKVNEAKARNTGARAYNSFSSAYGYKNRFEKY